MRALDGRPTIERMIDETAGELTIIAGSGVTPEVASVLIRENGVTQIHASASASRNWADRRLEQFGFASGPRRVTDHERVAALKQAIERASQASEGEKFDV